MPQLIPSPWFLIMLLTWTVILTTMLLKTSLYEPTNNTPPKPKQAQHNSWDWPW
uniref:ATP synthase complex subunit 8 n=1 Tax=Microcaecilia dermatophaga TaxID=1415579 RepID=W5RHL2_9AMPH|nr:ATP synthase F0 subunit 8 [Microcaecilia dermatophaga]AGZ19059.1 ATP synthase F0 subunit 8 [Microcaecilia dermatophaga]